MKESEENEKIVWSLDLIFNLSNCQGIQFEEKDIKYFFQELGEKVDEGGEIIGIVNNFGEHDENMKGLRVIHETQNCLITAHLVFETKNIYINLHSCIGYRPSEVVKLVTERLKPEDYSCQKVYRN